MRHGCCIALAGLALAAACDGGPGEPVMREDVVPASAVVGLLDTTRTYEYRFVQANPDSLLAVLRDAGVAVTQAWLPLDNRCMDPRGPVFTVELAAPDPAMLAFDFVLGTGRLACATQLRRYRVR
jgi:hypothetical protein